jgi:hypothetical protein
MNCRPEIVEETRKCEFERACRATRLRLGFEYVHQESSLRKNNGRSQSVRPRANHIGPAGHPEICFRGKIKGVPAMRTTPSSS